MSDTLEHAITAIIRAARAEERKAFREMMRRPYEMLAKEPPERARLIRPYLDAVRDALSAREDKADRSTP